MCQFLSAIATRDGQTLVAPLSDSHEELIAHFDLHEKRTNGHGQNFIRIEFTPGRDKADRPIYDEPDKYKLRVDEDETPSWFDDEARANTEKFLRGTVERMIIRDERKILLGGVWILAKGAKVAATQMCRIVAMDGAVIEVLSSSNVGVMRGSSNVGVMRGSSNVGEMRDSSNVGEMCGSSNVGEMRDSSNVGEMCGWSNVGEMRDSSNVGEMCGWSNVGVMCGSSRVGVMWDSSNIPDETKCVKDSRAKKAAMTK